MSETNLWTVTFAHKPLWDQFELWLRQRGLCTFVLGREEDELSHGIGVTDNLMPSLKNDDNQSAKGSCEERAESLASSWFAQGTAPGPAKDAARIKCACYGGCSEVILAAYVEWILANPAILNSGEKS